MVLLPRCSCCGTCGCKAETKLPYTMTVTLNDLNNKTRGNYCDLLITSDVGGGASGVATAPGGCDGENDPICGKIGQDGSGKCSGTTTYLPSNRGPLAGVLLTAGGSGYISLRSQPTVTAGGGSGTGAKFDVTLKQDKCDWIVKSVAITDGKNYLDGDQLSFSIADGDTQKTAAHATLHTVREEPTLTASVEGGTSAELTIDYKKNAGTPSTWSISGITVTSGGTGYSGGAPVIFTVGKGDKEVSAASATITTNRVEPTLSASAYGAGSGAVLTVLLDPNAGGTSWSVSGITVSDGGSGYSEWDYVAVSVVDGQEEDGYAYVYAYVAAVDENGAITAVEIYYSYGAYFKEGGVIQSATLSNGGTYFKDTGTPLNVTVEGGGRYYRDDPDGEPCAPVTVEACEGGTGAEVSATVDATKGSPTYGQITGLTIDNGGDGYLAWHWINTCNEQLNGIPFVLKADTPEPLVTLSFESCYGSGAKASVTPLGIRTQPDICIVGSGKDGTITPTLESENEDGNSWLPYWSIASVSASGGYGYTNNQSATIDYRGATVSEAAQVTLQATGVTEEDPPNAKNDGVLTGATVVKAGKSYVQHAYDGAAGPIKLVKLDSGGSGYARYGREEPALKFTGSGTGATFTPTFKQHQDKCNLDYWEIESVSASGGTGYVNGEALSIALSTSNDKSDSSASVTVYTREAPSVSAAASGSAGSGASFAVTLTKSDNQPRTWSVKSVAVNSGGTRYTASVPMAFTVATGGTEEASAEATATANESGTITEVSVSSGGSYYLDGGKAIETKTLSGGHYYRENKAISPYVADVTVTVDQVLPSNGSGAEITATIESSTSSTKFGQITKLTISDGGSGYQLLGGPTDCRYSGPCGLALQFRGSGNAAEITLQDAVYRTTDKLDDCTKVPSSAPIWHSGEGSVTIAAGGAWDDKVVCPCNNGCTPCGQNPDAPPCGQSVPCPTCVGECDTCNKCGSGCGCKESRCVPCCGPCDDENPCPEGCVCKDGKCVRGYRCLYSKGLGCVPFGDPAPAGPPGWRVYTCSTPTCYCADLFFYVADCKECVPARTCVTQTLRKMVGGWMYWQPETWPSVAVNSCDECIDTADYNSPEEFIQSKYCGYEYQAACSPTSNVFP